MVDLERNDRIKVSVHMTEAEAAELEWLVSAWSSNPRGRPVSKSALIRRLIAAESLRFRRTGGSMPRVHTSLPTVEVRGSREVA